MIALRILLASALTFVLALPLWIVGPLLPEPNPVEAKSFSQSVSPEPVKIYCPGGLIQQGGDTGTEIGEFEIVSPALIQVRGDEVRPSEIPGEVNAGFLFTSTSTDPEQSTLDLVASSLASVSKKRMAGLAAINCAQPVSRGILLGGDSQIGTESLLIVSNPQEIETLVKISLIGLEETLSQSLVLAPAEQKYFSLAALSGDLSKYVVQFESAAGEVSVVMQQRVISGLSPIGVEISDWVSSPAKEHTFPIVKVLGSNLSPDKSLSQPTLRIFNQSETQDTSTIKLVSASGSQTVTVVTEPGTISDTPLELSDGDWSAFVESSQEVFVAIRNPVLSSRADFEWLNPANPIESSLALTAWSNSHLHLANPTSLVISYRIAGLGEVSLAPQSRKEFAVPRGALVVESDSKIWAALSVLSESGYAVIEPRENKNFGSDLKVLVH